MPLPNQHRLTIPLLEQDHFLKCPGLARLVQNGARLTPLSQVCLPLFQRAVQLLFSELKFVSLFR